MPNPNRAPVPNPEHALERFAESRAVIEVRMAAQGAKMPTPDLSRPLGRRPTRREIQRFAYLYADALRRVLHPRMRIDAQAGDVDAVLKHVLLNRPSELIGAQTVTLDVRLRFAPDPPVTYSVQLAAHQDGMTMAKWDVSFVLDSCRKARRGRWIVIYDLVHKLIPVEVGAAIAATDAEVDPFSDP